MILSDAIGNLTVGLAAFCSIIKGDGRSGSLRVLAQREINNFPPYTSA